MKQVRKTSRGSGAEQSAALAPWLKEIESVVLELVPDAPLSLVRRRTAWLDKWLQHALNGVIEPRPFSVYDGVIFVAGPNHEKKRLIRSFSHLRDTYLDMLEGAGPLLDSTRELDVIADERDL